MKRTGIALAALSLLTLLVMSCGTAEVDDGSPAGRGGTTTDSNAVATTLSFGRITLPDNAKILGVEHYTGIDEEYRIAIAVDPAGVDALLARSNFTAPFEPLREAFFRTIDGQTIGTAADATSARDQSTPRPRP